MMHFLMKSGLKDETCPPQCTSGFINDGDQLKVTCPSCRKSFCAQCKKPVSTALLCFLVFDKKSFSLETSGCGSVN